MIFAVIFANMCYHEHRMLSFIHSFFHSFILSSIYKVPHQETYSEAPQPSHGETN